MIHTNVIFLPNLRFGSISNDYVDPLMMRPNKEATNITCR